MTLPAPASRRLKSELQQHQLSMADYDAHDCGAGASERRKCLPLSTPCVTEESPAHPVFDPLRFLPRRDRQAPRDIGGERDGDRGALCSGLADKNGHRVFGGGDRRQSVQHVQFHAAKRRSPPHVSALETIVAGVGAVRCDRTRGAAARRENGNAGWTRGRGRIGTVDRREETKEMDHAEDARLQQQIVAQCRAKRPDDSVQHIGAAPEHARLAGRAKA